MQDKTIDNALLRFRRNLILNGGDGLDHVEALLRLRGLPLPKVIQDNARRGPMRHIITEALRDGPQQLGPIVAHVMLRRPDLPYKVAYERTSHTLYRMKLDGQVKHEGRVWWLALPGQPL